MFYCEAGNKILPKNVGITVPNQSHYPDDHHISANMYADILLWTSEKKGWLNH